MILYIYIYIICIIFSDHKIIHLMKGINNMFKSKTKNSKQKKDIVHFIEVPNFSTNITDYINSICISGIVFIGIIICFWPYFSIVFSTF